MTTRFTRDEFDLPYPRHPALCEPETVCICGDQLQEHDYDDGSAAAIVGPPKPLAQFTETLTLRRRDGSWVGVCVPFAISVEWRCRGWWADQRCRCRKFVEATPEQAEFTRRRRAADYLGWGERHAKLLQETFDQIWRKAVASGDEVHRQRAKRLALRHGLTIPEGSERGRG